MVTPGPKAKALTLVWFAVIVTLLVGSLGLAGLIAKGFGAREKDSSGELADADAPDGGVGGRPARFFGSTKNSEFLLHPGRR